MTPYIVYLGVTRSFLNRVQISILPLNLRNTVEERQHNSVNARIFKESLVSFPKRLAVRFKEGPPLRVEVGVEFLANGNAAGEDLLGR